MICGLTKASSQPKTLAKIFKYFKLEVTTEIENDVIHGRGTLDTKGGLYCMLKAADELAKEGIEVKRNITKLFWKWFW